jgi:hypothetical protein
MQWLLREQTKHFEFALVYGSYVLMTGITMSFSGVVDILHAAPSQQFHLLPSSD